MKLAKSGILCAGLVLAVMTMGCQGRSPTGATPAHVMGVVSGQTIEIPDLTGQTALNQQLRLIGISAPDWRQHPWGEAARNSLDEKLRGQTVLLEEDVETVDDYDRHLAYVWLDDVLVNEWLVEEGLAMVNVRSPNLKYEQRLNHAQQTARILGRGIWNPENPMRLTPAEFRQQGTAN
jgi:micrococcal nuclease